jgi:hypothetical protein
MAEWRAALPLPGTGHGEGQLPWSASRNTVAQLAVASTNGTPTRCTQELLLVGGKTAAEGP